ncbi:MAG: SO_0444 family Cu/Zn efflux transporter [Deltaproteobacteria bacterium]|nr:SO_0444 family Cu/Zn efflux transporter [Deltaproteobacteria bacterium]
MEGFVFHFFGILIAAWQLFVGAAIYILFGLIIAGIIHLSIRKETIGRHLGARNIRAVLKAAIVGIPLPLCSCGVLPTAMSLRKEGASKAATTAFLIATPESGIDSIAVTYALIDPLMTVIRPVAAFVTALCAGIAQLIFGTDDDVMPAAAPQATATATCCTCADGGRPATTVSRLSSLSRGLRYAFIDLLADITPTFLLGILLGGLISYLVPTAFIEQYLGQGWQSMLVMLFAGIPIYICAAASTPIAAALLLKGMNPGAAIVFLLAGPATNMTALPVIAKGLGWRSVAIYLTTIAVCTFAFGLVTDALYATFHINLSASIGHGHHPISLTVRTLCAIALLGLMIGAVLADRRSRVDTGHSHHVQ